MKEPYPKPDDDPIMCQMCETWQPRYAPYNVCCRKCNIELVRQVEGDRAARDMEKRSTKLVR